MIENDNADDAEINSFYHDPKVDSFSSAISSTYSSASFWSTVQGSIIEDGDEENIEAGRGQLYDLPSGSIFTSSEQPPRDLFDPLFFFTQQEQQQQEQHHHRQLTTPSSQMTASMNEVCPAVLRTQDDLRQAGFDKQIPSFTATTNPLTNHLFDEKIVELSATASDDEEDQEDEEDDDFQMLHDLIMVPHHADDLLVVSQEHAPLPGSVSRVLVFESENDDEHEDQDSNDNDNGGDGEDDGGEGDLDEDGSSSTTSSHGTLYGRAVNRVMTEHQGGGKQHTLVLLPDLDAEGISESSEYDTETEDDNDSVYEEAWWPSAPSLSSLPVSANSTKFSNSIHAKRKKNVKGESKGANISTIAASTATSAVKATIFSSSSSLSSCLPKRAPRPHVPRVIHFSIQRLTELQTKLAKKPWNSSVAAGAFDRIITQEWDSLEVEAQRRVVEFTIKRRGGDGVAVVLVGVAVASSSTTTWSNISKKNASDDSSSLNLVVSCIRLNPPPVSTSSTLLPGPCFLTSVDLILILEFIKGSPLPAIDKNRIRRTLEKYRPMTVLKSKTCPYFCQIMVW